MIGLIIFGYLDFLGLVKIIFPNFLMICYKSEVVVECGGMHSGVYNCTGYRFNGFNSNTQT